MKTYFQSKANRICLILTVTMAVLALGAIWLIAEFGGGKEEWAYLAGILVFGPVVFHLSSLLYFVRDWSVYGIQSVRWPVWARVGIGLVGIFAEFIGGIIGMYFITVGVSIALWIADSAIRLMRRRWSR